MKTASIIAGIAVVGAIAFGAYMIDIDQTREGTLPDIDVDVQAGQMPEYDVEVGEIETGTTEVTLDVPTISIETPDDADDS